MRLLHIKYGSLVNKLTINDPNYANMVYNYLMGKKDVEVAEYLVAQSEKLE